MGPDEPTPDENCLTLSVWTPEIKDGRRRPVMFYLHGGGFTLGSAGSPGQDGANLASKNDVVVVQCNHRLGLLGYLFLADVVGHEYLQSGNQGMLDIVAALDWVRRNIEAFGGDPGNVMVWGISGGGVKTETVYAMPSAAHLFHKASFESGAVLRVNDREQANRTTHWVLDQLNLPVSQARKLLEVPATTLLALQVKTPGSGFWPLMDGLVLPAHPFDPIAPAISAQKPLIVGTNHDEAVFLHLSDKAVFDLDEATLLKRLTETYGSNAQKLLSTYRHSRPDASSSEIFIAIETAAGWGAPSIAVAERKAMQGAAPVYMYVNTDAIRKNVSGTDYPIGAMHATDGALKFDTLDVNPMIVYGPEELAEHRLAAANFTRMWTAFARDGKPAAPGQPEWPPYTLKDRATMMVEGHCHVALDPYPDERRIWGELA
jgi:para-nitrobenzyl esterase